MGVIEEINHSIQRQEGEVLRDLLRKGGGRIDSVHKQALKAIQGQWRELWVSHHASHMEEGKNDVKGALKLHLKVANEFGSIWKNSEGNWLIPVLGEICAESIRLCVRLEDKEEQAASLGEVERIIKSFMATALTDREENPSQSKKLGALLIINTLMRIYFLLHNLRLCRNLIKYTEGNQATLRKYMKRYPKSQRLLYEYYVGRVELFEGSFESARKRLLYVFEKCPKEEKKRKKMVLIYLIPLQLLHSILAKMELLVKYDVLEFKGIIAAMKQGDINMLEEELGKNQAFFIHHGIFLLLEKLKVVTYRNLIRMVHKGLKATSMLQLKAISTAFKLKGVAFDDDEMECMLANLIYDGYIKGYVSHKHKVVVLSTKNPFPST